MSPAALKRRKTSLPVLGAAAAAWILLLLRPGGSGTSAGICCVPASSGTPYTLESLRQVFQQYQPFALLMAWLLMLVAMMAPMLVSPLQHVLDQSFARRRARAVLFFLAGYIGIWMVAGIVILSMALAVRMLIPNPVAQVAMVGILVVVWQCSPAKQVCLNRAHAQPELSAFGWKSDRDALSFGFSHGDWCVGSCWALMWLSEMFAVGHLIAMAIVMLWILGEHIERPTFPSWRLRGLNSATRIVLTHLSGLRSAGRKQDALLSPRPSD
jgi:predicted metal-binding membrane protein